MTTAIETEQPKVKPYSLLMRQMVPTVARRNDWHVVVDAGITVEQLLNSQTWSVVSQHLNFLDRVEVVWSDRSAYAELLCLAAGRGHATMHLLHHHQLPAILTADPGALPPGFNCTFTGPLTTDGKGGYEVVRVADGVVISSGHPNREAAIQALLEHASLR